MAVGVIVKFEPPARASAATRPQQLGGRLPLPTRNGAKRPIFGETPPCAGSQTPPELFSSTSVNALRSCSYLPG